MSEARGLGNIKPKAGSFVLLAILVAITGVFLAGRAQGWFEPRILVTTASVYLPPDSTLGLEPGAEVQILGSTVGSVTATQLDSVDAAGVKMHFTLSVRGKLINLVRKDSQVQVLRKFGVAGSPYLLITAGTGDLYDGKTSLPCSVPPDLTAEVVTTLHGLNAPDSPVQKMLAHAEQITSNLAAGKGAAGMLLSDPKTGEQLTAMIGGTRESIDHVNKLLAKADATDVNGVMDQVRQTLSGVDQALKEVTAATAMLRQQAKDLPGLVAQTQEMMRQTTRLIEGMQKSWLLRDHVPTEGSTRLQPGDAGR